MSNEHRVMKKFKKDIDDHLEIIDDELKKGNLAEVMQWYNELLRIRRSWKEELAKPGLILREGSFPRGFRTVFDSTSSNEVIQRRIKYADTAIKIVEKKLQSKARVA